MRTLSSLKCHVVHFLLAYLLLSVLMSLTLGSFNTTSTAHCEYEDANLTWSNTQSYSFSDVKAMAWYKGKGNLIATWLDGKGFVEYPPYIGRLMHIGETVIKIRRANKSDSGTYWLSLTLASSDYKIEATTHLEVIVAPSSLCKPRITQEGSLIKADLPYEECGIPQLTPKWKHNNNTIIPEIQQSSRFLDMGTNPKPGEYVACAEGESATCYKGNISDLCSGHTIPTSDHGSTPGFGPIDVVIALLIALVLAAIVLVLVHCRHRISCKKPVRRAENEDISCKAEKKSKVYEMSTIEAEPDETSKAVQPKTKKKKELPDTVKYLRELYKDLVTVPLSPSGEGEDYVNVSELYVNISFRKVEIADLKNEESNAFSGTEREDKPLISNYQAARNKINQCSPIFLFGDCGSGKSAWCKHLVQCWLQCSDVKDINIECLGLPDLQTIKILLYLPLQFSDRGVSFQELLKKHIFKEKRTYQEFVMKYVKRHSQKVLIVMDGLDIRENVTPISDISNDKHMSSCTVVVTARPASLKLLKDTCHVKTEHMRLFRVSKMTLEDATAYASSVLKHINQLHDKNFKFADFWRFTEHLHVKDLLSVPYICLVMLHVWMKNKNCFTEITHILFDIIYYYLQSATSDQQRKEFIESVSDRRTTVAHTDMTKLNKWNLAMEHGYLLHVLSRIAAQILYSEIEREPSKLILPQIFLITDEDDRDLQRICETGLLTEPLSLSANKKVSDMTFPDRLIFQFFVSIFIALREGKDCDFILSHMTASMQNSMIIHMLFQLSDKLVRNIVDKTIKSFRNENTNSMLDERRNESNETFRYCITFSDASPVLWLHSLMYNDSLYATKLLFLSTALHCIDKLNSLELTNHENNENLVFQLPCLSVLESLTLDINNCTLLLCKEWDNHIPRKLKEVVIRSVNINTGTLGLFINALGLCAGLEKLELFPSIIWTDDNDNLSKRPNLANYSWNELSKCIQGNTKLKTLELNSLILVGVVDTLLSRLVHYENLETITLTNLSSTYQEHSPPFHSCCTDRGNDDDIKKNRMKLRLLSLEKLKLLYSPIDFMFYTTKKGETKIVTNKLKVLAISTLEMPEKSWETLGSQIGYLTLSELHLSSVTPGSSLQILLDSTGTCKEIVRLSLCNINSGNTTPSFSCLANLKQLSQLQLRGMKLDVASSRLLFKAICECKQLKILSLCNIDIEEIPNTLYSVRELRKLSKLTADSVTIKRGSGSLSKFLNAFTECGNLKSLYVRKQNASQIPSKLSAITKWI